MGKWICNIWHRLALSRLQAQLQEGVLGVGFKGIVLKERRIRIRNFAHAQTWCYDQRKSKTRSRLPPGFRLLKRRACNLVTSVMFRTLFLFLSYNSLSSFSLPYFPVLFASYSVAVFVQQDSLLECSLVVIVFIYSLASKKP